MRFKCTYLARGIASIDRHYGKETEQVFQGLDPTQDIQMDCHWQMRSRKASREITAVWRKRTTPCGNELIYRFFKCAAMHQDSSQANGLTLSFTAFLISVAGSGKRCKPPASAPSGTLSSSASRCGYGLIASGHDCRLHLAPGCLTMYDAEHGISGQENETSCQTDPGANRPGA